MNARDRRLILVRVRSNPPERVVGDWYRGLPRVLHSRRPRALEECRVIGSGSHANIRLSVKRSVCSLIDRRDHAAKVTRSSGQPPDLVAMPAKRARPPRAFSLYEAAMLGIAEFGRSGFAFGSISRATRIRVLVELRQWHTTFSSPNCKPGWTATPRHPANRPIGSRCSSSSGGDSIDRRGPPNCHALSLRRQRLLQIRRLPDRWVSGKRFA